MDKEFVGYTEALALKELGFDEPCFVYWVFDGVEITFSTSHNKSGWSMIGFKNNQMTKKAGLCTAPTYQQAFRWFREKYKLFQYIEPSFDCIKLGYQNYSWLIKLRERVFIKDGTFKTYEETELACLKKLIEIAKETK
jgi:hypothetical protein